MEKLLADQAVSMSEFKRNPAAVMRVAGHRPVAVLNHNRPAFYMVEPLVFEAMLEAFADRDLEEMVRARRAQMAQAIEVDIETV